MLIAWFCQNKQNRKVSAKSVTMRATALCKNLSGYRELCLFLGQGAKIFFSYFIQAISCGLKSVR